MRAPARRGLLLALVLLLASPVASAQQPDPDPLQPTPQQLECQPPFEACLPDLRPMNAAAENEDERSPTKICASFLNLGRAPTATRFRVLLEVDRTPTGEKSFEGPYAEGDGDGPFCWEGLPLAAGTHTFRVVVDAEDDVIESNETNNAVSATFVVRGRPEVDLRARLVVTPQTGPPGTNQVFFVNVTNLGGAPSVPTLLDLFDTADLRVRFQVPALAPGTSMTFTHVTRTDLRPVGRFLAQAIVDVADLNRELSESNNAASFDYEVLEHPAPDLVVTNLSLEGNLTPHRALRLDARIENVGDRLARNVVVRVVNATNATMGELARASLYPGANATARFQVALPAGNYTLRVVVDPDGIVPERNESNNASEVSFEIVQPDADLDLPNLVIERIYALPETPRPGESALLGALVRNVGTNRSAPTTINFSVQGRVVATAQVAALAPGNTASPAASWSGGPAGTYLVEALVDPARRVLELDEGDNDLALDVVVADPLPPPEAPPTNVTPPSEPLPPTPTTPTTPTPTPATNLTPRISFSDMLLDLRPAPGGLNGTISAVLKNQNTVGVGRFTVTWRVDGRELKTTLHGGIVGAGTATVSSGAVNLPGGSHIVSAEVRVAGSSAAPVLREKPYEMEGGKESLVPGLAAPAILVAVAALALARRRLR